MLPVDLISITVDALAHDSFQTEITRDLIGNEFTADKYDGLVFTFHTGDEIQ